MEGEDSRGEKGGVSRGGPKPQPQQPPRYLGEEEPNFQIGGKRFEKGEKVGNTSKYLRPASRRL